MRVLAAAFLLAALSLQALAQSGAPKDLEPLSDRFDEFFRQGNLEGIVALFAPDASYVPLVGPARLDGHAGVREHYQRSFAGSRSRDITTLSQRWQLAGDLAIRTADVLIEQQPLEGAAIDTRARITLVYRRQAEGWRIVHHHGSQQPAALKPAAPAWGQCGKP